MITSIYKGLQAYTGAYSLISKLKLWKYFLIPIIISVLLFILIFFLAYSLSDNIAVFASSFWPWEWGSSTVLFITTVIGALAIIVLGLILYKHSLMALASPFMSPVSEKIESYFTGKPAINYTNNNFIQQLLRGIRIALRHLVKELLYTLPILLLKFIPVVNIFSTVLLFLVQAYYAGASNMDYTLERHFNYKNSIRFIKNHRGFAIGNGIGFLGLLLIPVLGVILVLPLSVTSASVVTVYLLNNKKDEKINFKPFETL